MSDTPTEQVHATCVAIDGHGILLQGPPGSGKSDLALRLINAGWKLVADDRVELSRHDGQLRAAAPAALQGLIEVRGLGVLRQPTLDHADVALICDLAAGEVPRLPEPRHATQLGVELPVVAVSPFEASAVIKVQLALSLATDAIMRVNDLA